MPARNVIEIVITAQDQASGVLESSDSLLGKIGKTAAIGAAAVVGAATAIGGGMFELAREAAPIEGVQKAFDGLVNSMGKNTKDMLKSLSDGSKGMITNTDLMKSFNSAAQLVSKDFAGQLPDAMQYLSKVSAATGQDMGFMLDSLVKGVGRVSPMILDNLGIQVNATEAMEEYAKANGKSADQLTKTEQQSAIMAKTLELLKKNTAAMPDITDNASTKWAAFQTRLANFKDDIGVKLLPFFTTVLDLLGRLADAVLPIVIPLIERISGAFTTFVGVIGNFGNILANYGIGEAIASLINPLWQLFGLVATDDMAVGAENTANVIVTAFLTLKDVFENRVLPVLQKFGNWFIQDVLPAVVQFVTGVVIPQIQNFMRILGDIWNFVSPVLFKLADWFINTGLPLVVGFVRDTVIPLIQKWMEGIMTIWEKVQPGLQNLFSWFTEVGLPAITGFIENTAMPIIETIIKTIGDIWTVVAPALGDLFAWFLDNGLPAIGDFINDVALPIIQSIISVLKSIWTVVSPPLNDLKNGIASVFNWIKDNVIQPIIDRIQSFIDKFHEIKQTIVGGVGAYSGVADNASTAANLVSSGAVSPGQAISAFFNAVGSEIRGHALGFNSVPQDGYYYLHQGEGLSSATENTYGGGNGGNNIVINFTGGGSPENQADADDKGFMIVNSLRARGMTI